jgi:hypothetical protein
MPRTDASGDHAPKSPKSASGATTQSLRGSPCSRPKSLFPANSVARAVEPDIV